MLLYATTIFLSAFLLFLVQPLIGKYILPWFGGSPAVWTTCMLFFQLLLLAGYAFAHLVNRLLKPRAQVAAYAAAMAAAVALLPIAPAPEWKPAGAENPALHILFLLTVCLGLPYFLLSSTGPLLQAWFSRAYPGRSPYRLYALSNLGSFVALLGYPFLMEPSLSRSQQVMLWSAAFIGYALLGAAVAIVTWRRSSLAAVTSEAGAPALAGSMREAGTPRRHLLLWILLAACGTTLLLAVTNELTQDVAVVPFLWVLPLSLYLLSFIITFAGQWWYSRPVMAVALAVLAWPLYTTVAQGPNAELWVQVTVYPAAMFVGCMICHGELYRLRPPPRNLTGFYLAIAAGGALGGGFVAALAPAVFDAFHELPIGFAATALLMLWASHEEAQAAPVTQLPTSTVPPTQAGHLSSPQRPSVEPTLLWAGRGVVYVTTIVIVGLSWLMVQLRPGTGGVAADARVVDASRNFYGLLGVHEHTPAGTIGKYRELKHGRITHGLQFEDTDRKSWGTGYYGPNGGGGIIMRLFHKGQARRIGIVGLGIGTQATYGSLLDVIRFYEINPEVERLARQWFTYLSDSRANIEVVMGDARLSLERESPQQYDILVLDAFSSDAIPVHLLTREAFDIYLGHLKPGGAIAVHISNRHLDLRPVVWRLAEAIGFEAAVIATTQDDARAVGPATWMLLTKDAGFLALPEIQVLTKAGAGRRDDVPLWTDDRTSLLSLIRWQSEP